ncbi:MAG: hypothetical protein OEY29_05970 [Gammaproteobacteria bacterium]|nr:hypothetical protein [Gammaproteobacteria bacterium]
MSINTAVGLSATLLLSVAMGSVSAAEADMTQLGTQEQVRTELSLNAPENEQAKLRVREQKMEQKMEQNKEQSQSEIRNENQNRMQSRMDNTGSMMRQGMMNRPMSGNR